MIVGLPTQFVPKLTATVTFPLVETVTKFAVTDSFVLIVIVTGFAVPEAPPLQLLNVYPLSAVAVRDTCVPEA
jgi:hypothetical protein